MPCLLHLQYAPSYFNGFYTLDIICCFCLSIIVFALLLTFFNTLLSFSLVLHLFCLVLFTCMIHLYVLQPGVCFLYCFEYCCVSRFVSFTCRLPLLVFMWYFSGEFKVFPILYFLMMSNVPVMVPYLYSVFSMWFECPELLLSFLIVCICSFIWCGILCLFVLCILVGSLSISFCRSRFCCSLFVSVVSPSFLLCSAFLRLLYLRLFEQFHYFPSFFPIACESGQFFHSNVEGRYLYFAFVGLQLLILFLSHLLFCGVLFITFNSFSFDTGYVLSLFIKYLILDILCSYAWQGSLCIMLSVCVGHPRI